ncbi:MAG: hypothetical protein QNJ20_06905 [Paracoccaceae bacterium]|nr:hypothetical protein [Paracoccaceae bacterium]
MFLRTFAYALVAMHIGVWSASAATFNSNDLQTIPKTTVDGISLTTITSDGAFGSGNATFPGLLVGLNDEAGTYEFAFSREIVSIDIFFYGLTNIDGVLPPEQITGFATEDGAVSIGFTNLANATFAGNMIQTNAAPAGAFLEGSGVISYSGGPFSSFFLSHSQNGINGGFGIDRIVVSEVPLPAGAVLLGSGLLMLGLRWRRRTA